MMQFWGHEVDPLGLEAVRPCVCVCVCVCLSLFPLQAIGMLIISPAVTRPVRLFTDQWYGSGVMRGEQDIEKPW